LLDFLECSQFPILIEQPELGRLIIVNLMISQSWLPLLINLQFFQVKKNFSSSFDDCRWQPSQSGYLQPITPIGRSGAYFSEENDPVLKFFDCYMIILNPGKS